MSHQSPDPTPDAGDPTTSTDGTRAETTGLASPTAGASTAAAPRDLDATDNARPSLVARAGAEALGTFILVLVGVGLSLYAQLAGPTATVSVALGFAFAVTAGAVALGHVSGGHFNPAITLGAMVAGRAPARDLLPYWLAQLVGAALAAAALFVTIPTQLAGLLGLEGRRAMFATAANGYGDHSPLNRLSQGQVTFDLLPALVLELVATAVLVGVVLGTSSRHVSRAVAPVAMGLAYGALVLLVVPVTNAGLNPARSTAAALFSDGGVVGQLWVFWAAPLVGAAIAGLAHRAFTSSTAPRNVVEDDDPLADEESHPDDEADPVAISARTT